MRQAARPHLKSSQQNTKEFPKGDSSWWIAFIYAIPADAIVRLSLRSAWKDFRHNQGLVSVIMWGVLLSFFMTILLFLEFNAWRIFLLGIPGQLAIFLAFRLRKHTKEE